MTYAENAPCHVETKKLVTKKVSRS